MTTAQALGLVALAGFLADFALWVRVLRTPTAKRREQIAIAIVFLVVALVVLASTQQPSAQSFVAPLWQIVSGWVLIVLGASVLLYQIVQAVRARRRPDLRS